MASAAVETLSTAQEPVVPATGDSQVADPVEGNTKNASLYVGDLDKDVSETHLFELFSEVSVASDSAMCCRDAYPPNRYMRNNQLNGLCCSLGLSIAFECVAILLQGDHWVTLM